MHIYAKFDEIKTTQFNVCWCDESFLRDMAPWPIDSLRPTTLNGDENVSTSVALYLPRRN